MVRKAKSWVARLVIGAVLLLGGILAVAFFRLGEQVPEEEPAVRPVKSMVVVATPALTERKYPGRVRANQQVNLAFQVAGPLVERPVKKGEEVNQGQLLAKIDPRDFENEVAKAKAMADKAVVDLSRIKTAFDQGAATEKEVDDAQARLDIAKANLRITEKALDDTNLRAPFAGTVADTFVENYQNVNAKEPILSLQDTSHVEIVVDVPEEQVARVKEMSGRYDYVASFDYFPDLQWTTTMKEYAAEADPVTHTYPVTFVMPSPEEVNILPGMTATIEPRLKDDRHGTEANFLLPLEAVPVDELGQYYVWTLEDQPDGSIVTRRANVSVGEMSDGSILVTDGLNDGDRIATAGTHVLREGQRVRPVEAMQGGKLE